MGHCQQLKLNVLEPDKEDGACQLAWGWGRGRY